jgi:hypothetical protein
MVELMVPALLAALLSAHLLLVGLAMAGPLACVWLEWREARRGDVLAGRLGLALARASSWALTLGIGLGFVLLAAWWPIDEGRYITALVGVPHSRLWFGGAELLFYFACMGAYTGLWSRWRKYRWAHAALAMAAATNLLLHFPALFIIVSLLNSRPELMGRALAASEYRRLLVDGEVLSKVVHVWLSAAVVAGAVVVWLALRRGRDAAADDGRRLARGGALLALAAGLMQLPVGFWVTMSLPESARAPLLGGDALATILFVLGLLAALALVHHLAALALGDLRGTSVRRAVALLCALVVLMVGTRLRLADRVASAADGASRAAAAGPSPYAALASAGRCVSMEAHSAPRARRP